MTLFGYLWRSSRRLFVLAVLAGLVSGGTGAAFIALVNQALAGDGEPGSALVVSYLVLCTVTIGTRYLSQAILFRLSQGAIYQLRRRLLTGTLDAPLRTVERIGTPGLYSALSDDVVVVADALPTLPGICSGVAFVVVAVAYLTTVAPAVAGATAVAVVVGAVLYRLLSGSGLNALHIARAQQDRLFGYFRAVTEGVKELKLSRARRDALLDDQLDPAAQDYRRHSVAGLTVLEGATQSGQAVFFGFIGVLLFVLPGALSLSTRTLTESVLTLLFAVSSMQSVLTGLPALGRASVALASIDARLADLERIPPERPSPPGTTFGDWRAIRLARVAHEYPGPAGERFTLGPVDLEIRRGEILFVVGANGSGKTTLAKVLTGLYPPESGLVEVAGVPVDADNRDAYRQLFSVVFSDFFLFDDLLGIPVEGRGEEIDRYLRHLRLDHAVHVVGDRFSTTALSTGQRKRLALLVAFLEDRPCYVFDEWAADQDPVFKDVFYRVVLPDLRRRAAAVVVISHDDRYFDAADRLVRLDYGRIREEDVGGHALAGRPETGSGR